MNTEEKFDKQTSVFQFPNSWKKAVLLSTVSMFLISTVLNGVYIDSLYQLGVNLIFEIQTNFNVEFLKVFMNIISLICNMPGVATVFLLQIVVEKHKLRALMHISFFLMGFYIIMVYKQAIQQSRPIWSSEKIDRYEWSCPTDFGDPSGHSYVPFPLFEPLIANYVRHDSNLVFLAWLVVIFFTMAVPFSRMYLGVHSINQVIFGMMIGISWVVLFRYGVRERFYKIYQGLFKEKKPKYLIITLIVHCVFLLVPLIVYLIRHSKQSLPSLELANLNKQCSRDFDSNTLIAANLLKSILESVVFGFLYGFYFLEADVNQTNYFSGKWRYKNFRSGALHVISIGICTGLVPGIAFLIISFIDEPYSKYFLFAIGLTAGGFGLVFFTPKVQRMFQWIEFSDLKRPLSSSQLKKQQTYMKIQIKGLNKVDSNVQNEVKNIGQNEVKKQVDY